MKQKVVKVFFNLINYEINGHELRDDVKNLILEETLPALFNLSKMHDLAHLVGDALEKNGLLKEGTEGYNRFIKERNVAIYRYEQLNYEYEQICNVFEQNKINFIPLKGSVIRKFYPNSWMRTSCDIDILVKEEDLRLAIDVLVKNLNYTKKQIGNHDAQLYSQNGIHLELHYKLQSTKTKWSEILDNVWNYVTNEDGYKKQLSNEFFYFYHIAHIASHFKEGGCGVRFFLDLFILNNKLDYNNEKLQTLLEKYSLLNFYNESINLARFWFDNETPNDTTKLFEEYVLYSGMYGNLENRIIVKKKEKKGKFRYLLSRIFLPYNKLKYDYPKLQKCCILYPYYILKRFFKFLFNKKTRNDAVSELNKVVNIDKGKQKDIQTLLDKLDI